MLGETKLSKEKVRGRWRAKRFDIKAKKTLCRTLFSNHDPILLEEMNDIIDVRFLLGIKEDVINIAKGYDLLPDGEAGV